jgi:hypothetical protein
MTPRRRALTLAAAVAVLAAGCGDDGGDRLSTEDYRSQATRICQDAERQTDRLGQPETPAQFKRFLERGIVITDRNLKSFEELEPPEDLQDEHDAIVERERSGLERLRRLSRELKGNQSDLRRLQAVQPELDRLSDQVDARFRAAGLNRCAENS